MRSRKRSTRECLTLPACPSSGRSNWTTTGLDRRFSNSTLCRFVSRIVAPRLPPCFPRRQEQTACVTLHFHELSGLSGTNSPPLQAFDRRPRRVRKPELRVDPQQQPVEFER